jgi:glucose-6-phosphate 1-dehydrogenase
VARRLLRVTLELEDNEALSTLNALKGNAVAANDTTPTTPTASTTRSIAAQVEEPKLSEAFLQRPEESCVFVIFGASGDLTSRKLIPALYNLSCQDLLPPEFTVIGFASTPMSDDSFRDQMCERVKNSPDVLAFRQKLWDQFAPTLHYVTADFENPTGFRRLGERLSEMDKEQRGSGNRLFYLATSPSFYQTIVNNLKTPGLVVPNGANWTRIIFEKPFGRDLDSARRLNDVIHRVFDEDQVYRIDHYLGKETVQNILAFRFANSIIEPIWNHHYVDHVQITAAETLGVEHRGKYYEEAGCLRDMFQNHLLQLLALIAMEPPVRYGSQSVRDRKADALRAILPINPENLAELAVRGQYGPGEMNAVSVLGYREEPDVASDSQTETFAALKLIMDNWRWAQVPFYLRSGKRMSKKLTLVSIEFKRVPHLFFDQAPQNQIEPNVLTIRIQPDEGISLKLGAKAPGPQMHISQMQMDFSFGEAFGEFPATAYETLLLDAMHGDATLFNRNDAVELSWQILEPVLETWHATRSVSSFPNYAAGTWGPANADALLTRDGRAWKNTSSLPRSYLTDPDS